MTPHKRKKKKRQTRRKLSSSHNTSPETKLTHLSGSEAVCVAFWIGPYESSGEINQHATRERKACSHVCHVGKGGGV
jgi:hypothetical protein